jgi:Uncharacterized conserved protein
MILRRRFLIAALAAALVLSGCGAEGGSADSSAAASSAVSAAEVSLPYGVYIGMDADEAVEIGPCETAVIDASGFTAPQIAALHTRAAAVYSYLNVGSIETFRDYYGRFQGDTLGPYEGWPGEYWIDVSSSRWQSFVVDTLAAALREKGVDGLFLDNFDVYGQNPGEAVYQGLLAILRGLRAQGLPVIVNGGDEFIRRALESGDLSGLVYGVNQESVFTADVSGTDGPSGPQDAETTSFYETYLEECAQAGLQVFLIEYGAEGTVRDRAAAYCREHGFCCFFAASADLNES